MCIVCEKKRVGLKMRKYYSMNTMVQCTIPSWPVVVGILLANYNVFTSFSDPHVYAVLQHNYRPFAAGAVGIGFN